MPQGTVRTDLSRWETYKWDEMGIQLERPVAAVNFNMHPHSCGTICDGVNRILIEIERFTPETFVDVGKISSENPLSKSQEYMEWLKWMGTFQDQISERPLDSRRKEFRRDVRTKAAIITIHVTYAFDEFRAEERFADETAIKRILLSAKAIDGTPQPTDAAAANLGH